MPDISGSVYSKTQVGAVLAVCCFAGKQDGERGLHRERGVCPWSSQTGRREAWKHVALPKFKVTLSLGRGEGGGGWSTAPFSAPDTDCQPVICAAKRRGVFQPSAPPSLCSPPLSNPSRSRDFTLEPRRPPSTCLQRWAAAAPSTPRRRPRTPRPLSCTSSPRISSPIRRSSTTTCSRTGR